MKHYELTLFGGTGVTGRAAYRHLASTLSPETRWAIAGRSQDRLEALRDTAPSTADIVLADLENLTSIESMIRDSKVIIHLAGPYAENGEPFFELCIKHRTHYVDIGGETFFLKAMIARYHEAAKERGVILLPTAGYESVPFDLLTKMAIQHMRAEHGVGCLDAKIIGSFHHLGSGRDRRISNGSLGTMRSILAGDQVGALNDMACLLPPSSDNTRIRRRNRIVYKARYDEDVERFVGPLQPAPFLNVPVVLRSAHLLREQGLNYGDRFTYCDAMTMEFYSGTEAGQKRAARRSARLNQILSLAMRGPKLLRKSFVKRIDTMASQPGEGPDESTLGDIDYELKLFATAENGQRVHATCSAKGHPGYLSTSKMVAEVGLYLSTVHDLDRAVCGVVTPAVCLDESFLIQLERADVKLTITP